jgi:hypothetical protein
VSYAATQKTPIRLELYGIDGRTMVESYSGSMEAGQKTLVWQPKHGDMAANVYILEMKSGEVMKSQLMLLAR